MTRHLFFDLLKRINRVFSKNNPLLFHEEYNQYLESTLNL